MPPINKGLSDAVIDRAKDIYSAMKADDKAIMNAIANHNNNAEDILWGRAINIAKKQVQTMDETKLKDIKISDPIFKKCLTELTKKGFKDKEIREEFLKLRK